MNKDIVKRVKNVKDYILETKKTIREIAHEFDVSKSTVHKDLSERLKKIDNREFLKVGKILKEHTDERHIRGGESTKKKYKKMK